MAAAKMIAIADWWARGLGAASLVIAAISFALARRDARWRRRAKHAAEIRSQLARLRSTITAGLEPVLLSMRLWSPETQPRLELIDEHLPLLTDRRLTRRCKDAANGIRYLAGPRPSAIDIHDAEPYTRHASGASTIDEVTAALDRANSRAEKIVRKAPP